MKTNHIPFSAWASFALAMELVSAATGRAQNVIAWGRNTDGQRNIPVSVTNPVCIAAGGFHSLALNADGTMAAWGKNRDGQTNVPPPVSTSLPSRRVATTVSRSKEMGPFLPGAATGMARPMCLLLPPIW
jgi:Regulator of chromosome condensation (RCC1) repeat